VMDISDLSISHVIVIVKKYTSLIIVCY
jgi:hypothetical protein